MVSSLVQQGIRPRSVLDVGANAGQFTVAAAKLLAPQTIHSFEPLSSSYQALLANTARLQGVTTHQIALGSVDGQADITVNRFPHSSSLLPLGARHAQAFPEAMEQRTERVEVRRLDSVVAASELARPCLLKLDVQGFEKEVLKGARESLRSVDYVIAELSFRELYVGEPLFDDMCAFLKDNGFSFLRPLDFLRDPRNGEILQMDALFGTAACR
jgi:FkbM family methyltransferase